MVQGVLCLFVCLYRALRFEKRLVGSQGSNGFRDLAAGISQRGYDLRDTDGVFDALDIGNGEAGNGVSLGVEDRKADIDNACDLVAGAALVSAAANPDEMLIEVGGFSFLRFKSPFVDGALAGVLVLVGEDNVATLEPTLT
jgi:hypothetical protein